eukprot:ANDGO_03649.mRNA.1 Glucosidase 2 subunit beta
MVRPRVDAPSFVFLLLSFAIVAVSASLLTRREYGVHPSQVSHYISSTFRCFDGSREIPIENVNDDYCHCADGSDERGTSACAHLHEASTFWCRNEHFEGKYIRSAYVMDSVCDCCDGSDESDASVVGVSDLVPVSKVCPNTCVQAAEVRHRELQAQTEARAIGLQQREAKIKEGLAKYSDYASRKGTLEMHVGTAQKDLESAKEDLRVLEDVDERAKRDEKEREEDASVAASDESSQEKTDDAQAAQAQEQAPAEAEKESITESTMLVPWLKEQVLGRLNAATAHIVEMWQNYKGERQLALEYAKAKVAEMEKNLSTLRSEMSEITDFLAHDFGPRREYVAYYKQPLTFETHEYSYQIRPFEAVDQRDKSGRLISTLGKFDKPSWVAKSGDNVMKFTNGDRCWQGPQRSMVVRIECGATEEVVKVEEPSRCEYAAVLRLPIACVE